MIGEPYQKYYRELTLWCLGMTGNPHIAEELVQEAFLRAMLHEDVPAGLQEMQRRSWLYRTVKNLYVDRIRHGKRETLAEESLQREACSDGVYQEEIALLEWEELLGTLPDMEGVIFSLRYLDGYNSGQIGRFLSLPPGTIRSRLSSARQHLRELLGGKKHV